MGEIHYSRALFLKYKITVKKETQLSLGSLVFISFLLGNGIFGSIFHTLRVCINTLRMIAKSSIFVHPKPSFVYLYHGFHRLFFSIFVMLLGGVVTYPTNEN